ncbi:hypothetical protein TEHN7118_0650 [Tetragenococcus halophilus subsp. halophilus]|uniref:cysteine-S-conjugate beta-lyase n=1 Tax=Tetragenococcus halophilus subsp. halophilus TaxID=1513897 RepID=A0A2H6CSA4_TETHA|nr:aminotransferase class I/II-fold pyridoxal phosphate-dependent enzyme [Tetragenococcus halophilus]GBD67844.1 hypothetical protein TEHN7118_0650 [Tetragenococcus halophilus subsp. halophilus]
MDKLRKTRVATSSKKWGRYKSSEILPLWIADMDIKSPEFLEKSFIQRAKQNYFGYTDISEKIKLGIIEWYKYKFVNLLQKDDILFCNSVLHGYSIILQTCLPKNGSIIVFTPLYPPLMKIAEDLGIEVIEIPIVKEENYRIDFKLLEKTIKENSEISAITLCNPHNPIGKVWSEEVLSQIINLTKKYTLLLISDEIHSDLILDGNRFYSILDTSFSYKNKMVVLHSPAKTFNVAGLKASFMITRDQSLQKKLVEGLKKNFASELDIFSITMMEAIYTNIKDSYSYINSIIQRIEQNYRYLETALKKQSRCEIVKSQASFLVWIKVKDSACNNSNEIREVLREKYAMDIHEGTIFRGEGKNYIRMNIGCPKELLERAISQFITALENEAI